MAPHPNLDSIPGTFAFVEKYLRKSDCVYVEGEIDYRSYETAKGDTRWTMEIKGSAADSNVESGRRSRHRRLIHIGVEKSAFENALRRTIST